MFNVWVDSGPFHLSVRHDSVPKALWSQEGVEASGTQSRPVYCDILQLLYARLNGFVDYSI